MSATTLSRRAIRQRVAEAAAGLGQAGWKESRYHPDQIGKDPRSVAHLSFGVAVGDSVPSIQDRQRRTAGAVTETTVTVRWLHRLRTGAEVGDYDEALDAGEALTAAVLGAAPLPGLSLRLVRAGPHTAVGDGTHVRQDLEFAVFHLLSLEAA